MSNTSNENNSTLGIENIELDIILIVSIYIYLERGWDFESKIPRKYNINLFDDLLFLMLFIYFHINCVSFMLNF